jgi:G:T-mismatch repair DNA endonuclease (very short patch repair protein)
LSERSHLWIAGAGRQLHTAASERARPAVPPGGAAKPRLPQETRLRLLISRAGLPPPIAQFRIHDDEGLVARADFACPDLKIAIEYDGIWHGEPGQFAKDRRRLNRLTAAGRRVIVVTAVDVRRPEKLVARLVTELSR